MQNIRLDVWTPSKMSRSENPGFKSKLIVFYRRSNPLDTNQIKCMVLDQFFDKSVVIGAHIWKASTQGKYLEAFGLHSDDVWSERNGFLLYKSIEKLFDAKEVCFLYDGFDRELKLAVLNPNLRAEKVLEPAHASTTFDPTFSDIDGEKLQLPPTVYPFKRILNFHAKCALRLAVERNWMSQADVKRIYQPYLDTSDGAIEPEELVDLENISF